MRRRRANVLEEGDDVEINMTPMLDIVFIMLIFFIVTTSFIKPSGISVNQPRAATAERRESANIVIGISAAGEIWIGGHRVPVTAVRATISRMHAQNPDATIIVQADKKAPSGLLVRVMDQVRLAGVSNMAIAAQPR